MSHTAFFTKARQSKSNYACEKEWARHFARAYYHEIDATRGFLPIYNELLSDDSEKRVTRASVKKTTCVKSETEADKRGKHQLNCILHKEYNDWYDTFDEDSEWSWHAAKKLSRKTGIDAGALVPVVQAWLLEKP